MILHQTFDINEQGHLTIGGLDAVSLSREFGTPAYYLDCGAVRAMCRLYKENFAKYYGENSLPVYAGKALCFKGLYSIIAEEGLAADCVSSGELATAHAAGFPMEKVFFHGNNKTDEDLRFALSLGVGLIVVDGMDELLRLDEIAGEVGVRQNILLRITPGIDPHTHVKITTGNVDSKFGSPILTGQAFEIVKSALRQRHLCLKGFHCHIGSQLFDIGPFSETAEIMLAFIAKVKADDGYEAEILNIGGGFGVRYTEDDPVIDYAENIRRLGARFDAICASFGLKKPVIFMEPGRSMVASAGATLYTVGSVKEVRGFRNYVSVDGGMPDNPRYALYQSRYTVVHAQKANAPADFPCTLAGRCCESGDLLAEEIKIPKPERGDLLAVLVTGAYNYSMASNYNRIPRPPVILIENGEARVGVRRETFEDLMRLDV